MDSPGDTDIVVKEVVWPVSARSRSYERKEHTASWTENAETPSENSHSSYVTPQRRTRSGRASVCSSHAMEQSYDEFVRLQNVTRFMLTEKERGVRTFIMREEHDKWLELRKQEREERLRLGGMSTEPSTPVSRGRSLSFLTPAAASPTPLPPPGGAGTSTLRCDANTAATPALSVSRGCAAGQDTMPDSWRDRFRGIYVKPTPNSDARYGEAQLESRCCSVQ